MDDEQKKENMITTLYNGVKSMEYFFVPVGQMPVLDEQVRENEQTPIVFEMLVTPERERWFAVFTSIDEYNASGYEQGVRIYYGEMIRAVLVNEDVAGLYIDPYGDGVQIGKEELLDIFQRIAEEGER